MEVGAVRSRTLSLQKLFHSKVIIFFQFPFMGKTNPEVFMAVTRDSVHYDPKLPSELVSLFKGVSYTIKTGILY